jgi:RNA polymerase sigma-70 factor (ECF subfamily)
MQRLEDRPAGPTRKRRGETAVHDTLVADFEAIRRWLLRRCRGDAQAAGEILAAFCLRALTRAPELRDAAAVRGWLAIVLRSTVADHWRSARAERRRVRSDDPQTLERREEYTLPHPMSSRHSEPCDCLPDVVAQLRQGERDVLQVIDLGGGDRAQHAERLGLTRNALDVRLHRARAALRTAFLAHCDACSEGGSFDPSACPSPAAHGV